VQPHQIREDTLPEIGADTLTQPGYEIETYEGAHRHGQADTDQERYGVAQIRRRLAAKAAVYQYLHTIAKGQLAERGERQSKRCPS
jgi:hypothetical protein